MRPTSPRQTRIQVAGYQLEFEHHTGVWPREVRRDGKRVEVICVRRTVATLIDQIAREPAAGVTPGYAYCAPEDTFDKEIGRQVALKHLLPHLPKEPRGHKAHLGQQLLRAYLTRPHALPWVIDPDGQIDYGLLMEARAQRIWRKESDRLMQQLLRLDNFVTAVEVGRQQGKMMAQMLASPPMEDVKH